MSDSKSSPAVASAASATAAADTSPAQKLTAGAMLSAARQQQGLALEQLASLLKVPVRKLEALEADRIHELPGLAFVRGLATAVARQLGLDVPTVLEALPQLEQAPQALENVTRGLATPYREPMGRIMSANWPEWLRPSVVVPAVLLLLALVMWLAPSLRGVLGGGGDVAPLASKAASVAGELLKPVTPLGSSTPAVVDADGVSAGSASAVIETVHSSPADEAPAASGAAAGPVVLRINAESWIEARDATGAVLLSRMLLPGEVLGLEGTLPIKLKIGNADGTRVSLRGASIDLTPYTRDNVARVELK